MLALIKQAVGKLRAERTVKSREESRDEKSQHNFRHFPKYRTIFVAGNENKMLKIGLLSDTHGYCDKRFLLHFAACDEIWHAGDIGSQEIIDNLRNIKTFRAVHGNADSQAIRREYPQHLRFRAEAVDVWMTHIGGYPGKYAPEVSPEIFIHPPKLFISGHSHILKVKYDKTLKLLHINPGAAGKQGWQQVRTLVRFIIDGENIQDLEVIELSEST